MATVNIVLQTQAFSAPAGTVGGPFQATLTPADGSAPLSVQGSGLTLTLTNVPPKDYNVFVARLDANTGANIGTPVQLRSINLSEFGVSIDVPNGGTVTVLA